MKKLATAIAVASLAIAAPAFACPHDESTPKTADKAKDGQDKAKEQPKKETETARAKDQSKDQPKKEEPKKPEKVSQK